MAEKKPKEYSNGEVTVVWQADKCIHSTFCWKGLGKVFKPKSRPWVDMEGGSTEEIVAQVKKCPSGALSYYMNGEENQESQSRETVVDDDHTLVCVWQFLESQKEKYTTFGILRFEPGENVLAATYVE